MKAQKLIYSKNKHEKSDIPNESSIRGKENDEDFEAWKRDQAKKKSSGKCQGCFGASEYDCRTCSK